MYNSYGLYTHNNHTILFIILLLISMYVLCTVSKLHIYCDCMQFIEITAINFSVNRGPTMLGLYVCISSITTCTVRFSMHDPIQSSGLDWQYDSSSIVST